MSKEKSFALIGLGVIALNTMIAYVLISAGDDGTWVGLTTVLMLCLASVINYLVNFRPGSSRRQKHH